MIEKPLLERSRSLFIDGEWRSPEAAQSIAVVDPSSGGALAQIGGAREADVDAAVAAAAAAFPRWRRLSGGERGRYLRAFAKGLEPRREALVRVQMRNSGKPRSEAETDVSDAIATFDYYADMAEQLDA